MADTKSEAERIAASYSATGPIGITRTIQLERDLVIAALAC
jgi:hypothetical protein